MPTEAKERRVIYRQDRERGYCPRCGVKVNKRENYAYCEDCREYFRNYNQERSDKLNRARKSVYAQRKKNNQCPRCGKKLGKRYEKILCPVCLEKQYQYNYG